jgi:membrane associated rhomboid family serine protease
MTDATPSVSTDNHCYRHPKRESFVKCQRCGRTICGECQTLAPVGVHCPECVRESRASAASSVRPVGRRLARVLGTSGGHPIVTYTLIGLCLVIYGIQFFTAGIGDPVTNAAIYVPDLTLVQPWRMITSIFIHESILHVGLNMYSLFLIGPALERMLGRIRYLAVFLICGFGGSVGVLLLAPHNEPVLGASGAIFGLFGAYFLIARRLGGNVTQIFVVIVINLVIGFIPGFGIAWQAHVGGLATGLVLAFILLETRARKRRLAQILLIIAVFVVLVVTTLVKAIYF